MLKIVNRSARFGKAGLARKEKNKTIMESRCCHHLPYKTATYASGFFTFTPKFSLVKMIVSKFQVLFTPWCIDVTKMMWSLRKEYFLSRRFLWTEFYQFLLIVDEGPRYAFQERISLLEHGRVWVNSYGLRWINKIRTVTSYLVFARTP